MDLGQGKSIVHQKEHIPDGQDHLHFKVKSRSVYAVNKDGTAHDRSHGKKMQRWALDGAKTCYPDFKMPDNGLIEEVLANERAELLAESSGESEVLISQEDRREAALVAVKQS